MLINTSIFDNAVFVTLMNTFFKKQTSMEAKFKPIFGYESHYHITKEGDIKRCSRTFKDRRGRIRTNDEMPIVTSIDKCSGYRVVKLTKPSGGYGNQYVHRLVALTFIPNPYLLPEVNHINGVKTDARAVNLEWCTKSENRRHAVFNGLCKPSRQIEIIDDQTLTLFESIKVCSKTKDIQYDKLRRMLSGEQPNTTTLRKSLSHESPLRSSYMSILDINSLN